VHLRRSAVLHGNEFKAAKKHVQVRIETRIAVQCDARNFSHRTVGAVAADQVLRADGFPLI
jgi:hypothetical protein